MTAPSVCARRRVLIVEDHRDSADILAQLLTIKGFEVSVARTHAEAIETSLHERFDAIICDIALPDGNSYDLPRQVKAEHPTTRVLAFTALGMPTDVRACRDAGFDDHLLKPLDLDKLLALLC